MFPVFKRFKDSLIPALVVAAIVLIWKVIQWLFP